MRALPGRASLSSLFSFLVLAAACASSHEPSSVQIGISPTITLPRDLFSSVATLSLTAYDQTTTSVACDTTSGVTSGITASTTALATATLGTTNCTGTAKFCGQMTLTQITHPIVFAASALDGSGTKVAVGCATATLDQQSISVAIKMVRFVPPATCGNGTVEPTEQCDPKGSASDMVCDANCHTKEEALSTGMPKPTGPASLVWPAASGATGEMFAFFTTTSGTDADVGMRILSDALGAVSNPAAAASPMYAPNDPNQFPPVAISANQSSPSGVALNGVYWYAFADTSTNGDPDIHLRSFDASLTAQQPQSAPIGVNGASGAGEANIQSHPSMSVGPSGHMFIAWQDDTGPNSGQVVGRVYDPASGLGLETVMSSGTGNVGVQVAGTSTGWIAVWQSGSNVQFRTFGADGTPAGPPANVNDATHHGTQDHPSVAVLSDGRAAVVWADHGASGGTDIFVQRFDLHLSPIPGDQSAPINNVVTAGEQITPSIGGSSGAGGSYVAAWVDSATGNVRACVLGGSGGYLFNSVDGQPSEFPASIATGKSRANPVVVGGGAGPYVAIAWDESGIVVRRFPAPSQ